MIITLETVFNSIELDYQLKNECNATEKRHTRSEPQLCVALWVIFWQLPIIHIRATPKTVRGKPPLLLLTMRV
jgi:hypothetical protein